MPLFLFLLILVSTVKGQVLSKTHFKIVLIDSPPFVYYGENDTFSGFMLDMLEEFKRRLTFTYELYKVPDGKYGGQQESGEWTGLMGEVISGNADMALAPLTVSAPRSHHVLFSTPFMEAGIVPLCLRPGPGEKLPFQSVLDLATNTDLKYGTIAGGSTYSFFKANTYKLYRGMGEIMTNNSAEVMARNVVEAAARVREGGYVFLGEEPMLTWLVGDEPCDLMTVGSPINARYYGIAFHKKAEEIAAAFSRAILEMKESGLFKVYKDTWWEDDCKPPKLCVCHKNNSGEGSTEETEPE